MKELIIASNMIAIARGHKPHTKAIKSAAKKRSAMLKMIMPFLSRETGERLAMAVEQRSSAKFSSIWDQIKREITAKLDQGKHKATAATVELHIPDENLIGLLQMVCKRLCAGEDPCPLEPMPADCAPQAPVAQLNELFNQLVASSK
jgi:hypothetical protein